MTVSSHLTPEPERRLWLLLENVRASVDAAEKRAVFVAALSVAELCLAPAARGWAVAPLLAATLLSLAAAVPLERLPRWSWLLRKERPSVDDCLLSIDDIAKYAHGELILKLDKYLGGGVTATPYFEDAVGQILAGSRLAGVKGALVRVALALLAVAQLALVAKNLSLG